MPIRLRDALPQVRALRDEITKAIRAANQTGKSQSAGKIRIQYPGEVQGRTFAVYLDVVPYSDSPHDLGAETSGYYEAFTNTIGLISDKFTGYDEHVEEVILHELAHAVDLTTRPRHDNIRTVIVQYPNSDGTMDKRALGFLLRDLVEEFFAIARPEAFPKKLTSREDRAHHAARLIGRHLHQNGFFRLNSGVDKAAILSLLDAIAVRRADTRTFLKGLDKETDYLRTLTERRAFTQSILAEVRSALERGECGDMIRLHQSGMWGPRCANRVLEDVAPSFQRMKARLTEDEFRRVLIDLAKLIQEEFFTGPKSAAPSLQERLVARSIGPYVKKALDAAVKAILAEAKERPGGATRANVLAVWPALYDWRALDAGAARMAERKGPRFEMEVITRAADLLDVLHQRLEAGEDVSILG